MPYILTYFHLYEALCLFLIASEINLRRQRSILDLFSKISTILNKRRFFAQRSDRVENSFINHLKPFLYCRIGRNLKGIRNCFLPLRRILTHKSGRID